jgi:hypothetical protein
MDIKSLPLERSTARYWVIGILITSILLRWILIFKGGQYYFSDEQRYQTSQTMTELLLRGQVRDAGLQLFSSPEHLGYKVIGIFPAWIEQIMGPSRVLPAMFFSLFSALNLYLIFLLSKKTGTSLYEALLALLLAAISQSLFYYSRHFMPYDTAMTFGLLAFYIGLTDRLTMRTSITCGALSFLCFITYNGYWTLAGLALFVHVFYKVETITRTVRKGVLLGIGFLLPLSVLIACSAQLDVNFVQEYRCFAQTVTQGNYEEGWSLPFAYFWNTEHFLFVILALLALYALLKGQNRKAAILWGSCIVLIYLFLAVPSVYLHSFVVYGRLVRQIMPFLILLAASGFVSLSQNLQPTRQGIAQAVLIVIFVQALWNFNSTFHVAYPRDFVREVQVQYPDFSFSPKRFAFGAPEVCEDNGYVMQNAKYLLATPETSAILPGHILLSASHPVNFLPYQYEGYTPEQRQAFRESQLRMVFYELDPKFAETEDFKKVGILSCLTK